VDTASQPTTPQHRLDRENLARQEGTPLQPPPTPAGGDAPARYVRRTRPSDRGCSPAPAASTIKSP